MPNDDEQAQADRRFDDALERTGARDPRGRYRDLLRKVRDRSQADYEALVARWQSEVIGPLARDEGDPLDRWLTFGAELARTLEPGRTVVVDRSGRAQALEGAPSWRELVLHLPEAKRVRAIPVALPPELSPAQEATVDLLVEGRVKVPAD